MSKLRDFAPILIVICCAAVFGTLLMTGVIDLNSIPTLVEHRPVLAVCVVLLFSSSRGSPAWSSITRWSSSCR